MTWKCHDLRCDYCSQDLPDSIICDAIYGGHYDSAYCWYMGRERILSHVKRIMIRVEDER